MELETDGRSWFDVEADDLMEEFPGMSVDRLASELEANPEAYDGSYETALSVAAALRRRTVAWARGKVGPALPAPKPLVLAPPKRSPATIMVPGLFD